MYRTLFIAFSIIAFLSSANATCAQPQYIASINNPWDYAPVSALMAIFQEIQTLTNIVVDTYTITNIELQSLVDVSSVAANSVGSGKLDIQIALSYFITFSVQDQTQKVVALGSAQLQNPQNNFNLNIATTNYVTWSYTTLEVIIATATLNNIAFNSLLTPSQYTSIVNALSTGTTSIPNQLSTLFQSPDFIADITETLTQASTFLSSYDYNYNNINSQKELVQLTITPGTITNANSIITAPRAFEVTGQTTGQQCSTTGATLPTTLPGTQVEVYCLEVLQSIFTYAASAPQNYFNTVLNTVWNSPIFQFYAASLQNALSGIQGQYVQSTPATGACTSTNAALTLTGQTLTAGMNVNCQISNLNSGAGENLISVAFQLSVVVTPSFNSASTNYLLFTGTQAKITNQVWTANPNFAIANTDLANIYLNSIVSNAFNNQQLFGTGLPTLTRTKASFQWTTNQLIIYQAAATSE